MRWRWSRSGARRLSGILLAAKLGVLSGCAINPPLELAPLAGADQAIRLSPVPFFAQTEFECGPAALAGLLGAAGVEIDPTALSPQVYLPGRRGSLQLELVAATRRAGRIPYLIESTPEAFVAELESGRPVLVLQNLRTRDFPVWHYALLVGFDTAGNRLYLNSGELEGLAMDAPSFLRTWDWAGRWGMVALRPGELPAWELPVQDDPERYFQAVIDFEAVVGAQTSVPAWQAALQRWPDESLPCLALGNQAHAAGEFSAAVDYFRRGLAISPGDPALSNNLASVLGELGCPRAGEALLRPVASRQADDSGWSATLAATREELAAIAGTDPKECASLTMGL